MLLLAKGNIAGSWRSNLKYLLALWILIYRRVYGIFCTGWFVRRCELCLNESNKGYINDIVNPSDVLFDIDRSQ